MLGLWQTATLYHRRGVEGGRPVYEAEGMPFACRMEPVRRVEPGGQRVAGRLEARLFAEDMDAAPGDRVALPDGGEAILTEVARHAGPGGVHHLELLAVGGGGRG